ncbi:hypothetical protein CVT25_009343 [Psilocybe cyanescens]|uniref:Uncharacterized protein n=1 Tax=Psilocybe cyanescens TaxID=93625 RepID=A0A409VNC0_PSICY|nr:hypothetical protein CVT25_009343 [Psilocybe cyanescens]
MQMPWMIEKVMRRIRVSALRALAPFAWVAITACDLTRKRTRLSRALPLCVSLTPKPIILCVKTLLTPRAFTFELFGAAGEEGSGHDHGV